MGGGRKENIVMFPFMAQGHIIPFLALALKLEQERGYTITFINTPLNINNLRHSLPPHSSIRLLEIPFNSSDHGLPPDTETTETLPLPLILRLVESSPSLKPAFTKLISDLPTPPLCIISDMFFAWSAAVAHDFGTFHALFNAGGGYGMAVFHTVWLNLPHQKVESDEFSLPGFPDGYRFCAKELPEHLRFAAAPWVFGERLFREWLESDGMLFNTVEELDHTGLVYFRDQFQCPVWPIGPILSSIGRKARAGEDAHTTLNLCMKWLDARPSHSVLYVAFGSQNAPSESQTKQLALALEACGRSFIWVVRPPSNSSMSNITNKHREWLPKGFEDRINENGRGLLLVQQWAPQMEILSHNSIGAFLSHCGWNSVLEALSNGVPILSWPMSAEQPFNSQMLEEEVGVCVRVGNENGIDCDIVAKIEMVMTHTQKAKDMRRKAFKVKEMFKKGSSVKAMDGFLKCCFAHEEKCFNSNRLLDY